ncbi:MAG TPA: hypothetical protein CFH78_08785, partial [Sulfurimonas sp. UBA10385]
MEKKVPCLVNKQDIFISSKEFILLQWISYESPRRILNLHDIDTQKFLDIYAGDVFDYFMGVIS